MAERLGEEKKGQEEWKSVLKAYIKRQPPGSIDLNHGDGVIPRFIERFEEGRLTRDECLFHHFCVRFAAYDPESHRVFLGYQQESGSWLFSGGHVRKGEIPAEALSRKMSEVWGEKVGSQEIEGPSLLTISRGNHHSGGICQQHYEIWYFLSVSEKQFRPDKDKLGKEFWAWGWFGPIEKVRPLIKEVINDEGTLEALDKIASLF